MNSKEICNPVDLHETGIDSASGQEYKRYMSGLFKAGALT